MVFLFVLLLFYDSINISYIFLVYSRSVFASNFRRIIISSSLRNMQFTSIGIFNIMETLACLSRVDSCTSGNICDLISFINLALVLSFSIALKIEHY